MSSTLNVLGLSVRLIVLDLVIICFVSFYLKNTIGFPEELNFKWPLAILLTMFLNFVASILLRWAAGKPHVRKEELSSFLFVCAVLSITKIGMIALILIDWADRDPNVSTVTWELFLMLSVSTVADIGVMCIA